MAGRVARPESSMGVVDVVVWVTLSAHQRHPCAMTTGPRESLRNAWLTTSWGIA